MKRLFLPLLVLLTLLARPLAAQTPATTLSGTVRDAAGHPLPGVNVFLKTTFDGTSTDSVGRFRFRTRATGTLPLVVTTLGYLPQERAVTLDGKAQTFTFALKEVRNQLGDVVITSGTFEAGETRRSTLFTARDVYTTAGASADVAGAFNTMPGTTRNGEEGKLFVRGGAAGETKQYLDGMLLQSPYNASLGGVPARGRFSPQLFKGMAFSTGGYSAEYGQALSAVVALTTEDLAPETQTGISLFSLGGLSLSHQHRAERSSVAVSGDYMNMRPYFGLVPQQMLTAFESGGGSVALRHKVGELGMAKVYGQFTKQNMGVRLPDADWAGGRPAGLQSDNTYLNATFRNVLTRGWSVQTGLAATRDQQSQRISLRDAGTGAESQQAGRELEHSLVGRLVLTNDSASAYWNLKVGLEGLVQRDQQRFQAGPRDMLFGFDERRAAGFAETNFTLSNKLVGRVGARAEYSGILSRWNAAPRVALAYQLNEKTQLSGAWGYFYQTPANDLLRGAARPRQLRFEQARHWQLTYLRTHQNRTLRVEAYSKAYAHLVRYDQSPPFSFLTPPDPATYRSTGTGYARGLDVLLRDKKTIKNGDYWISYGFLDTRRQQRQDPVSAVPTFAARHNLSVVGKYWVGKLHTLVGATYTYNSPRAYYNPNDRTGYNAGRLPSFQDFSLNASYVTKLWQNFTIVHVSCSNVLGRPNVFGYRYGTTRDDSGQFARVAVEPSAPRMVFVALLISINKKRPADTNTAPE
ncbi:Outer membrane cobalamin receptor protein [Hymenobacter daecheongensis DSM 21074]|uniref:Outer membrane cobalamin receptor protein n=1 Tax=Hymenobacter daecheongensis DSM 21074 TaxID=1121955 RepID=A0A1M6KU14_9BACT|nr:TonB-dependent receptor [Hymenobacter daecheongensis]SHJ62445.1 Outer membrane cobalamin receptor protein [Hymenobacter daecheongensis DSM 21074]